MRCAGEWRDAVCHLYQKVQRVSMHDINQAAVPSFMRRGAECNRHTNAVECRLSRDENQAASHHGIYQLATICKGARNKVKQSFVPPYHGNVSTMREVGIRRQKYYVSDNVA